MDVRPAVTVLIADDHLVARKGLRALLGSDESIQIVGEAIDGDEAIRLVRELRPRVVLMDIRMPKRDGLAATRFIKGEHPTTAVVVVTNYDDPSLVVAAVQAGAAGFVMKDASAELLRNTIAAATSGGVLIDAQLLREALKRAAAERADSGAPTMSAEALGMTRREMDVLRRLAEGLSNREIGDQLGFAEPTIKKEVQSIVAKLDASDRTHAATRALRLGLID